MGPQGAWCGNKGVEFDSGCSSFVRVWDNRDFTCSPGLIKYTFRGVKFPRIQKKKKSPFMGNIHNQ